MPVFKIWCDLNLLCEIRKNNGVVTEQVKWIKYWISTIDGKNLRVDFLLIIDLHVSKRKRHIFVYFPCSCSKCLQLQQSKCSTSREWERIIDFCFNSYVIVLLKMDNKLKEEVLFPNLCVFFTIKSWIILFLLVLEQ